MKKRLIAYFSHAGENFFPGGVKRIEKGNTKVAAEIISESVNGVLFEIKEADAYPEVYKECVARAKNEYDTNARPELSEDMDISEFDVIYLGYPNWCGTMPMPVWSFLEKHDWTGKTICPFCTNEGSGLANSIADLEKLVPKAVMGTGLSIKGSQVYEARESIETWLAQME